MAADGSVFATALQVITAGDDSSSIDGLIQQDPTIVTQEEAYDEVMESVDNAPGGIAMAPVVGTLLHLVAKYGRVEIAKSLVEARAEVNCMETIHWHELEIERRAPLHLAIWSGSHDVVKVLVHSKADVSKASGPVGTARTPLEEAISRGYTEIAQCLLDAEPTAAGNDLNTLLLRAIQAQNKDIVGLLIDRKAMVNRASDDGISPLHVAARQSSSDIVSLLLERGADASKDHPDHSPLLSIAANAKAQFEEWVKDAPEGPERDWRSQMQDQHLGLVKVLLDSGALQVAPSSLRHVLDLFKALDTDSNGSIDKDELTEVLGALDPDRWTEARINQLLEAADANKDGRIQLDEFLKWVFATGSPVPLETS